MRSKYIKPEVEMNRGTNGVMYVKGAKKGPRTPEVKQALIYPQAQNVIRKFGGPGKMAKILKQVTDDPEFHLHRTTIHRWMYPREEGGTGGEIPVRMVKFIVKAARVAGIMLTAEELYPR